LTLGNLDNVELAQARERRDTARKQLAEDRDPGVPVSPFDSGLIEYHGGYML
jgi:hypothetical protein